MREIHDQYFRKAKGEGYRSRAAYKLIEIDDRKKLLRRGAWVLDAGCAPGSWLQVVARRVGNEGRVAGVDLKEIDPRGLPTNARAVIGDLQNVTIEELLGPWLAERSAAATQRGAAPWPPFDAVVSDIGPDTTGDPEGDSARSVRLCHALLDRCPAWLRKGGNLAMKVYEGGDYPELLKRTRALFEDAKGYKPEASRQESVEIFLIGKGWTGGAAEPRPVAPPEPAPRRGGWGR